MNSGIYKLHWPGKNNYFYIGQTSNLKNRNRQHFNALLDNRHDNDRLQKTFKKYGSPEFAVIEYCDKEHLDDKECFYLDRHLSDANCCNLAAFVKCSTRIKRSKEFCQKISAKRKGTKLSVSHREAISKGLQEAYAAGRISHLINRTGDKNYFYNKRHSAKTKKMISEAKIGVGLRGRNPKAKRVINVNNGIIHDCIMDAAIYNNIPRPCLYNKISGHKKNNTPFIYYKIKALLPEAI